MRGFVLAALFCVLTTALLTLSGAAFARSASPGLAADPDRIAVAANRGGDTSHAPHWDTALLDCEEPSEQAGRSSAGVFVSGPKPVANRFPVAADDRPDRIAIPLPERPPRA